MKKLLLSVLILFTVLTTTGCAMMLESQQYDYEQGYSEAEFSYLDDYMSVGWRNAEFDLVYGYYDYDRLFLVIYNGRIYIIPYDFFYRYIYPHYLRHQLHWYSYDYFCGLWGWDYYNRLWGYYHRRHRHPYWRPNYNWYYYHKNHNNNKPFVVRKNEIRPPVQNDRGRIRPPAQGADSRRIYTPRKQEQRPQQNYRYMPRHEQPRIYSTPPYTPPTAQRKEAEQSNSVTKKDKN